MKKQISLFLVLLFFCVSSFSQKISVTVDKQKIVIGEPIQMDVKASFLKGQPVKWFAADSIPHFEILQQSKIDTALADVLTLHQQFTITSWDSGNWVIESLGTLKIKPVVITVAYSPMDPAKPYNDIKDIIEVQKPVSSNWYWYLIGAIVLLALFLLFFPPANKKEVTDLPVKEEDIYRNSMSRLKQLNAGDEPKYMYTELIDIFRNYLQKRKAIQSFSKTTEDLAAQIKPLQLTSEQYNTLVQTMHLSDMVKFARFQPQISDNEKAIEIIKQNIITIENLH